MKLELHRLYHYIALAALALFYFAVAPQYMQGGDTAELVAASYSKHVPHPPGYPLYLWLQYFWTNVFQVSTVYWRASILSCIFGLSAIFILTRNSKSILLAISLTMLIGLKFEFVETSVLPDVFSLHALLIALIGHFFLFSQHRWSHQMVLFLSCLAATNHHTIIFILPCVSYSITYLIKKGESKSAFVFTSSGIALTFALYFSLFLCSPESYFSWADITDVNSLFRHILRKDYGTLSLSSHDTPVTGAAFMFLLKSAAPMLILMIISLSLLLKQKKIFAKDRKVFIWKISIILTLLFPLLMNVSPEFMGEEILRRFHVMPIVMLAFMLLYFFNELESPRTIKALALVCVPLILLNIYESRDFIGLRHDSVIENYSRNLFKTAEANAPSIVIIKNDSTYFALRALQSIEGKGKDVAVVSLPLFFHPWYLEKIQQIHPGFVLSGAPEVYEGKKLNRDRNIILPNVESYNFVVTDDYKSGDLYELTFFPVGRVLKPGQGTHFEELTIERSIPPSVEYMGPQAFSKKRIFYEYGHFYLARAFEKVSNNDIEGAKSDWEKAIEVVPYCFPAMDNLCKNISSDYPFCRDLSKYEAVSKGFF